MHGVHDTDHVPLGQEPGEGKHKETLSALGVIVMSTLVVNCVSHVRLIDAGGLPLQEPLRGWLDPQHLPIVVTQSTAW